MIQFSQNLLCHNKNLEVGEINLDVRDPNMSKKKKIYIFESVHICFHIFIFCQQFLYKSLEKLIMIS